MREANVPHGMEGHAFDAGLLGGGSSSPEPRLEGTRGDGEGFGVALEDAVSLLSLAYSPTLTI
jgi:hypothetical protein